MTKAEEFVAELYSTFEGRVPFTSGYAKGFARSIYPVVFENAEGKPIGLVAAAANNDEDTSEVQLFHVSAFKPGLGHGKEIMFFICKLADRHGVKLYLQAEIQFTDKKTPIGEDLINWYRQFGFEGGSFMNRRPNA